MLYFPMWNEWGQVKTMIVLFMLGLTCLAIAGMKYVEGISLSLIVYAVVGVVCVVAYLVNLVRKKMEK